MRAEYTILTPEKVAIDFQLASLGSRAMAALLDLLIMVVLMVLLNMVFVFSMALIGSLAIALMFVSFLAVFIGYPLIMEAAFNGRTLGKMAGRIRVMMADGSPITPAAAIGRNLLRLGDFLPTMYLAGMLAVFFTEKQQRLGDLVANTIVVHERANVVPVPLTSQLTEAVHPLEHLVGDLPGMTEVEYRAVKALCDRFPELAAPTQTRLLNEVWQPIANRLGVPQFADIHSAWLMEAVVMKYARRHGLL